MNHFDLSLFILFCFTVSGIAQVVWLKSESYKKYAYPVDFGKSLAAKRVFGENKTYAAFLVMTPVSVLTFSMFGYLINNQIEVNFRYELDLINWCLLGLMGGLGFHLGELPNSFLKRRMNIKPGGVSKNPILKNTFFIIDHIDSLMGSIVCMSLIIEFKTFDIVLLFILAPIIHWLFNVSLYLSGFKTQPR